MDEQLTLFDLPEIEKPYTQDQRGGKPRLKCANRQQIKMNFYAIDQLIPEAHIVRTIWSIVEQLDLSHYHIEIKSVEGNAGRPPIDPKILLSLWIYGTLEGIGSARVLNRYCNEHLAFIWLCGGVSVNNHTLSDFRNEGNKLEDLMTQIVASLIHQGIVSTKSWAQDGMRVRANAGKGSFRREKTLKECVKVAENRLGQLKEEIQSNPNAYSHRQKAAKERAATEQLRQAKTALKTMKHIRSDIDARKNRTKKEKKELKRNARVSKTDSEARKMKMPNGGYDPAYNVQYVSDTTSRMITGVRVTNNGNDVGQMLPMVKYVNDLYSLTPDNWLVDGGYYKAEDLLNVDTFDVETYLPLPEYVKRKNALKKEKQAGIPLPVGSDALERWNERMQTEEGKELYKDRASTAEYSNASTRNKGFYQFKVRGQEKAKATSLLFALTHNIEKIISMIKNGIEVVLVNAH